MALVAERWGLILELREFLREKRPVWGTCAGMIFLADRAAGVRLQSNFLLPCEGVASSDWFTGNAARTPHSPASARLCLTRQARRKVAKRCWEDWTAWCTATSSAHRSTASRRCCPAPPAYQVTPAAPAAPSARCSFAPLASWKRGPTWSSWQVCRRLALSCIILCPRRCFQELLQLVVLCVLGLGPNAELLAGWVSALGPCCL
jgi:SNO glutamine amidotransferase family